MTREAEINWAANAYKCACLMFDINDIEQAFRDGIEWADENPKNVWHSADQEPEDKYEILVRDEFGHFGSLTM